MPAGRRDLGNRCQRRTAGGEVVDPNVGPGIEFLGVDFAGNIYAGEVNRMRLTRYVRVRPLGVGGGGR